MRANLLDTNCAIFALHFPERLSATASRAILRGPNVLSVITYWEVLLKSMKGGLDVGDPRDWWTDALEELGATSLALRPEHVSGVYDLPAHHKDPFDRILIAQATVEELALVTSDAGMTKYASVALKIIR